MCHIRLLAPSWKYEWPFSQQAAPHKISHKQNDPSATDTFPSNERANLQSLNHYNLPRMIRNACIPVMAKKALAMRDRQIASRPPLAASDTRWRPDAYTAGAGLQKPRCLRSIVQVTILSADGLRNADWLGSGSDPYCLCTAASSEPVAEIGSKSQGTHRKAEPAVHPNYVQRIRVTKAKRLRQVASPDWHILMLMAIGATRID